MVTRMVDTEDNSSDSKSLKKSMDVKGSVFESFAKLSKDGDKERIDGGYSLVQHMVKLHTESPASKELNYILTRLVRGLGATNPNNRKGFFTTLTTFLKLKQVDCDEYFKIIENELKPSGKIPKSETANIYMGRILAYGALIRSKTEADFEVDKQAIVQLLVASKKRVYLPMFAYDFIIQCISRYSEQDFETHLWPLMLTEFAKSWTEYNIDTFHALLLMKNLFPSVINKQFFKNHLNCSDIISQESLKEVVRILTNLPRRSWCHHPVFELFCKELADTKYTLEFWERIDERFIKPSKTDEYLALEILKFLIKYLADKNILPDLLSVNFLKYMLKRLTSCKKHKSDVIAVTFKNILNAIVTHLKEETIKMKTQISMIKKLILYPGNLMIEKVTGTKIVQLITADLSDTGVKKLAKIYREIITNEFSKDDKGQSPRDSFWTNAERIYAAQLLTKLIKHPKVLTCDEWRVEQLLFFFHLGLCESPKVGVELAPHLKDSFYHSLDHKLSSLNDLQKVLSDTIRTINEEIFEQKSVTLRVPLTNDATEAWKEMIGSMKKLEKNKSNRDAVPMFITMNLHMGLQLFSDSEMAIMSIKELSSCFDRLNKSSKKGKPNIDEPEWVEVVVDLLLSLLSRNSHLLRSLVGSVFPHICPHLTASSVHQILTILDPKNDKNPLESNEDSSEDEEEEENRMETEQNSEPSEDENEDEDEEEEEEDDDDSDIEESNFEEDETTIDRLRLAVSQALGDASAQTDDEDIDVDAIDEEEGARLNKSLAAAFKILRENRQPKKQEKSAQALTHFRIRVLDLLDVYLESNPSMALVLDMIVPLFVLLEFCIKDPHQKPLEMRVRNSLKKLSSVKKFKSHEDIEEQVFVDILKVLIEKGERSASVCQEMGDKLAECSTFLIRCTQIAELPLEKFVKIYVDNLNAFFTRNCILPAVFFKSILRMNWEGNRHLAPLLVDYAFNEKVRSFKRSQALEFLSIAYSNDRFIQTFPRNERIGLESKLSTNAIKTFQELTSARVNENKDETSSTPNGVDIKKCFKQKFAGILMKLLVSVRRVFLPEAWDWDLLLESVTEFKTLGGLSSDTRRAFNKLASITGCSVKSGKMNKKVKSAQIPNGKQVTTAKVVEESESMETEEPEKSETEAKSETKKNKKNRSKEKNKQLLKKEARERRSKAMAEGLDSCDFSSVVLRNGDVEDHESDPENKITKNEIQPSSQKLRKANKKKRSSNSESFTKSKKRKNTTSN